MYLFSHYEDLVSDIYRRINVSTPGHLCLYDGLKSLNIYTFFGFFPSQVILIKYRYFIFLDAEKSNLEQFEDFGHEVAHVFLHGADQQYMDKSYRDYQEWRADLFSLHFCIPTFMILNLTSAELTPEYVSELFGVTIPFARKRLLLHQQRLLSISLLRNEKRLSP